MSPVAQPKIRLYVTTAPLRAEAEVGLSPEQGHYLRNVMRCSVGDSVAVFNAEHGEWQAEISQLGKRDARLRVGQSLRAAVAESGPWLLFAPLRGGRTTTVVEKATELGVSRVIPVGTVRSVVDRVNVERLSATAIEAAEQSERLSVPEVCAMVDLWQVLEGWPAQRRLLVCAEHGEAMPLRHSQTPEPLALLVGPEGGFTSQELDRLGQKPFVTRVSLGPRVLRADTAAIIGLALCRELR